MLELPPVELEEPPVVELEEPPLVFEVEPLPPPCAFRQP
jgi:hypothetical protein